MPETCDALSHMDSSHCAASAISVTSTCAVLLHQASLGNRRRCTKPWKCEGAGVRDPGKPSWHKGEPGSENAFSCVLLSHSSGSHHVWHISLVHSGNNLYTVHLNWPCLSPCLVLCGFPLQIPRSLFKINHLHMHPYLTLLFGRSQGRYPFQHWTCSGGSLSLRWYIFEIFRW